MGFISDSIKPSHHGRFSGELNLELRIKVYFTFNPIQPPRWFWRGIESHLAFLALVVSLPSWLPGHWSEERMVPAGRPASPLAEGAAQFHHGPWPVLAALPRKVWPLVKAAALGSARFCVPSPPAFLFDLINAPVDSGLTSPHLPLPVSSETGKALMSSPRRPSTANHQSTGLQPLDQEFGGHPSMPSSPATGSLQVPCRWGCPPNGTVLKPIPTC